MSEIQQYADGDFARLAERNGAHVDWSERCAGHHFSASAWGRFCDVIRSTLPSSGLPGDWYASTAELAAINGEMCAIHETPAKQQTPDQLERLRLLRGEASTIHYRRIALLGELDAAKKEREAAAVAFSSASALPADESELDPSGHRHAHLMALYARDAMETPQPWRRWEFLDCDGQWSPCSERDDLGDSDDPHPQFHRDGFYRRCGVVYRVRGTSSVQTAVLTSVVGDSTADAYVMLMLQLGKLKSLAIKHPSSIVRALSRAVLRLLKQSPPSRLLATDSSFLAELDGVLRTAEVGTEGTVPATVLREMIARHSSVVPAAPVNGVGPQSLGNA